MRIQRPIWTFGAALAIAFAAAACQDPAGPEPEAAPETIEELPRQLSLVEEEIIARSNAFAFDLLREVHADGPDDPGQPNIFLSPLSASMALGMTMNGAAGETFDSMRATLGFDGLDQAEINQSFRDLTTLLLSLDPRVELRIANSTWARKGFPFESAFFEAVRTWFDAEARELDFGDLNAVDVINGWAADKTNGRIREVIGSISSDAILFLLNAIYFKGQWTDRFDPARTSNGPFTLADGTRVEVERMRGEPEIRYNVLEDVEVGELPYGGKAFVMTIVLPRTGSLADLIASLDDATWNRWISTAGDFRTVRVELPKFELEYEKKLNDPLKALGMGVAFEPFRADFSRLTPAQDAHISFVKQNTYLKVDEEGTEAAAVTVVGVSVTSAGAKPPELIVDRPFLVAIRERLSGAILFIGAIEDPRG